MEIVRSGVGVNYREPPDEIGRVGISATVGLLIHVRATKAKLKREENSCLFCER